MKLELDTSQLCMKVAYGSRAEAIEARIRMSKRTRGKGNPQLQPYECPICRPDDGRQVWHLTTDGYIRDGRRPRKK